MKTRELKGLDRGRQRALDHRGVKSSRNPATAAEFAYAEGTMCPQCEAVYSRKTWRRSTQRRTSAAETNAERKACPACVQVAEGRAYGRVVLSGAWLKRHEDEVRQRIRNVEARAQHTQPERRVIEIAKTDDGIEVMSTSQKLAHRLVREVEKAFGGSTSYRWSELDGSLTAKWAYE